MAGPSSVSAGARVWRAQKPRADLRIVGDAATLTISRTHFEGNAGGDLVTIAVGINDWWWCGEVRENMAQLLRGLRHVQPRVRRSPLLLLATPMLTRTWPSC